MEKQVGIKKATRCIRRFDMLFPVYLLVIFLAWTKLFQLHDACFIAYLPGDDLSGVFAVIGLDDRPTAVMAVMAAPFEMVQVACHVDLFDDGITFTCIMGGFN